MNNSKSEDKGKDENGKREKFTRQSKRKKRLK